MYIHIYIYMAKHIYIHKHINIEPDAGLLGNQTSQR